MEEVMYGVILNGEYRHVRERTAGNRIEETKRIIGLSCKQFLEKCCINSGNRQLRSDTGHNQHKERIEEFFSDLFYLKCILERF